MLRNLLSASSNYLRYNTVNNCNKINGTSKSTCLIYRTNSIKAKKIKIVDLKYSQEDTDTILKAINSSEINILSNFDIAKTRIQKINLWRTKNGTFSSIEQLLDIDGFGEKYVAQFCNSILNNNMDSINEKPKKRIMSFTTPTLKEQDSLLIKSCVSLYIGISSISWIRLQTGRDTNKSNNINVSDWQHYDFSDNRFNLHELIQIVSFINYLIPNADVYVLETPPVARSTSPGTVTQININVQRSQLAGMISLALNDRIFTKRYYDENCRNIKNNDKNCLPVKPLGLFFLKQFVASRLFLTTVGGERVSNEKIVEKLTNIYENSSKQMKALIDDNDSHKTNLNQLKLTIDDKSTQHYLNAKDYRKEYMGNALLIGLAFIRLCMLRDPESLKIMSKKNSDID